MPGIVRPKTDKLPPNYSASAQQRVQLILDSNLLFKAPSTDVPRHINNAARQMK